MNSRQRIKVLKLVGEYDRRGKKCNDTPLAYIFARYENLRYITNNVYANRKALRKFRGERAQILRESELERVKIIIDSIL